MPVISYRDLNVWQDAIAIVADVYKATEKFPRTEAFGLASQIQRAAVSIPSNVAEGHARGSDREFHHFLSITLGSIAEVETQLTIAEKLGYLDRQETLSLLAQMDRLGKMVKGLQKTVKAAAGR